MSKEERCNTTLGLGIGVEVKREKQLKQKTRGFWLDLALPVHPKVEVTNHGDCDHKHDGEKDDQDSCSSKTIDDLEEKEKRGTKRSDSSNLDVYHDISGGSRKKLKLTTEQITLLEDSFKIHSTLNTLIKNQILVYLVNSILSKDLEGKRHQGRWKKIMHDQNQREVADSNRLQSTLEGEEEHESIEGTNVNTKRYWNRRRKYAPFWLRKRAGIETLWKPCTEVGTEFVLRAVCTRKIKGIRWERKSLGGRRMVQGVHRHGEYYEGTQRSRQERPGEVAENSSGTAGIERPQAFAGLSVEIVGTPEDGTPRKTARDDVKMEGNKDEKNTERVTGFCGRGLGIRDKRKQQRETFGCLEQNREQ
ncbi:hypothetical protein Tco_0803070 [Tanacetum coccineum]|uniref:Uncharacterized protein n=1 Tax=Tanacetum coccineum TaxID=301880 RepID=A0ABQ5A4M7_9ASTR